MRKWKQAELLKEDKIGIKYVKIDKVKRKHHLKSRVSVMLLFRRMVTPSLIPWAIVLTGMITTTAWIASGEFRVENVVCNYYDGQPCPPVITAELERYKGQDLLAFSPTNLAIRLAKADLQADHVEIIPKLPDRFIVNFFPQQFIAQVKSATNSASLLVSRNKVIVSQSLQPNLDIPLIIDPQAYLWHIGDRIDSTPLDKALEIAMRLRNSEIGFDSIIVYSDKLVLVELGTGKAAIFTTHVDIARQVTSLQLILAKATITQDLPVIDVRFDQPVLRPYR